MTTPNIDIDSICTDPTSLRHAWRLAESGYVRTWRTAVIGNTIRAAYSGTEDWSESGDERMYLECPACGAEIPVPSGYEIDYV